MSQKTKAAPTKKPRKPKKRANRKRNITADDLCRFHGVADPQISPVDGRIAFVKKHVGDKNNYVRNIWIAEAGKEPQQFTSGGRDGAPRWSHDGAKIAFVSDRTKGMPQVYVINSAGGEAKQLTSFPEGSLGKASWSPDGTMIAVSFRALSEPRTKAAEAEREKKGLSTPPREIDNIWYRLDGDGYFDEDRFKLFIVDVATGKHREVFGDTVGFFSFDWSPDSRQLAIAGNTDKRAITRPWLASIFRYDIRRDKLTEIPGLPIGPKEGVRWSPDGTYLAYASRTTESDIYDTNNLDLFICDAVDGKARNLTGKEDHCLMAVAISDAAEAEFSPTFCWAPNSKRIYMRIGWQGTTHIASVGTRSGAIQFHTTGASEYDLGSAGKHGLGLVHSNGVTLGEIHLGELQGDGSIAATQVTNFNSPLLKELDLSRPKSQWVRAADGHRVQVWSMMPPGRKPTARTKIPAVLEVHGGPHAQYGVSFFHEMQVLAAQGYAVFFSNPRGSKGYGAAHCDAIKGNWGTADWDDIKAVTDFIAEHPAVDPKRVGIMGGSYGGYMTNWAIGHSRAYRAAITDRCVSNLVSMAGNSDFPEEPGRYFPGNAWDSPEALWKQSPIAYFGKVRTPTLVIHSEGDLRCNVEQGEQVFTALKLRNIPTRFVRYPSSTSHGMSRGGPPDLRVHRLGEIVDWWKKYLA